jgi:hypothetical protein
MRTGTSRGLVRLERDAPTTRFFDTLKSEHNDERVTVQRCGKPMRGGFVEARGRDRVGVDLGEVKARRGSAGRYRVTPAWRYGLPGCENPRSRGWVRSRPGRRQAQSFGTAWREGPAERRSSLPGRENL